MSYILDALRQAQQARERGQVPRLHQIHQFGDRRASFGYWGMLLALGVASLALVVALFVMLRLVDKSPPSPLLQKGEITSVPLEKDSDSSTPLAKGGWEDLLKRKDLIAPPPPKLRPKSPAPLLQKREKDAIPPVKFTPPPAKPIAPAPRRDRVKAPVDAAELDYPDPNLSPAQEHELQRLLDGEITDTAEIAAPARSIEPEPPAIPRDLIDDIEAFKQQIKREQRAKFHHE